MSLKKLLPSKELSKVGQTHLSTKKKTKAQKTEFLYSTFFFHVVLGEDTLWHLQKFLQYIKYILFGFTPFTILHLPTPDS
jgi:hypothetical protein